MFKPYPVSQFASCFLQIKMPNSPPPYLPVCCPNPSCQTLPAFFHHLCFLPLTDDLCFPSWTWSSEPSSSSVSQNLYLSSFILTQQYTSVIWSFKYINNPIVFFILYQKNRGHCIILRKIQNYKCLNVIFKVNLPTEYFIEPDSSKCYILQLDHRHSASVYQKELCLILSDILDSIIHFEISFTD